MATAVDTKSAPAIATIVGQPDPSYMGRKAALLQLEQESWPRTRSCQAYIRRLNVNAHVG